MQTTPDPASNFEASIPNTLRHPKAAVFWASVLLIGLGAGVGAATLTKLLEFIQKCFWAGSGTNILEIASQTLPWKHVAILASAGLVTGIGQVLLTQLTSGNGIDITTAIWFKAGRLPKIRTLGSAVLSVILVGMGVSLGREGAPKQVGAVIADTLADRHSLSDEQRRLLVACGAGAGMAAAYGVPLGGALFALEVLRGMLALRLVLPAVLTSLIATLISWLVLPNTPTYTVPSYTFSTSILVWSLIAGPIAGLISVGYVRAIAWADRIKPKGMKRLIAPLIALTAVGAVSIYFPQILGNGRDVSQLAFNGQVLPMTLLALIFLKPIATLLCMGSGAPGGLFTPSLTLGALLGALMGYLWNLIWPGEALGLFALMGAAAVLAATTQGPISSIVLMMELTGKDRSFMAPLILIVVIATLVSRTIEPRSIYDARLTDEEVERRMKMRDSHLDTHLSDEAEIKLTTPT